MNTPPSRVGDLGCNRSSETKTIQHIVADATAVHYSFRVGGGIAGGGIRKVCP